MANLHGLMVRFFANSARIELGLTVIGSILVLSLATLEWRATAKWSKFDAELAFANAVMAAILVSYHLSPHDLTILLLSLTLIFKYVLLATEIPTRMRVAFIATLAVVFLPPLDLILLREHRHAYASLPILILFWLTHVQIRGSTASGEMQKLTSSTRKSQWGSCASSTERSDSS
jgi:hypothetical protein